MAQPSSSNILADSVSPALDIGRYVAIFRRRLRLFLGVAMAVLLAAILAVFVITPSYTAVSEVALDPRKHEVVNIDAVVSDMPTDTDTIDTEVEVLRSRQLAEHIVQDLSLDRDKEFNPALRTGVLKGLFGGAAPISPQKTHEKVVDALMKAVKISRTGLTYVISIAAHSQDPAKAVRLANAYAEDYIQSERNDKISATSQASAWLNSRLDGLRQAAEAADAAVQAYKTSHGLMSAEGNTLSEQDISNLTTELAAAQAAQAEQDAKLATARRQLAQGSDGEDVGEALSSPVIQQLRAQRADVSRHVAELEAHYGPNFPDLIKAKSQLVDFDNQIHAEILRVISGLEAQDRAARGRTASIQGSVGQSRARLASNASASVELNELERNADSARALYQSFLDRYKQTTAQNGIQQPDARLMSAAKLPTQPSMPNAPLFLAVGLVGGLGLGAIAAILAELFETGLMSAGDVEDKLGVACLATLPSLASTLRRRARGAPLPTRYLVDKPFSAFAESFRNLRVAIQPQLDAKASRVIAITSALPNEGKSTTSLCLAYTIAMAGESVVVVDCDVRRRSLRGMINKDPSIGLFEVMSGAARLDDALVREPATGAYVLPLSNAQLSTNDVFSTEAIDRVLAELKQRFSYIILDTAPVLAVADTRALAPKADGVVVVARWRKTHKQAVATALRELEMSGAEVLGVALSVADIRAIARAGAGYSEHYFKAYKSYYVQ